MSLHARLLGVVRDLGFGRCARLVLYAIALPPIALAPLALKEPQRPARIAIAVLLAAAAAAILAPHARARVARAFEHSALLRAADALLWNGLLALVLAEIALAIAASVSSSPLLTSPNARASWHVANVRHQLAASRGSAPVPNPGEFNDTAWPPKAPGSLRVVALGDSFAYGTVGYEHNFLTVLEHDLGERLGRSAEIANLGLPGMQPNDYLYLLEREGLAVDPDAVLVCLYAGNDFDRNKSASWLDVQRYRVYEVTRRIAILLAERRRSARKPAAVAPSGDAAAQLDAVAPDHPGEFSAEAYDHILDAYGDLLRTDPEAQAKMQPRIDATLRVLDRIVALADPRPVAIAVLPSELQADPALQRKLLDRLGLPAGSLDLDRPFHLVADHFAGRGVLMIDLLQALTDAHRAAPAYHPRETHWNEWGNRAAASALADALEPWLRTRVIH